MSKSVGGGAFLADRGQDVKKAGILEGRRRYECKLFGCRRIGCQEVKLLSVLRTKITSVTSQPSCPPNFCSSDNAPLPSPHPREGACSCKTNLQSNNCHCERQNGASQSPNLCNINEITTSNASPSPRNDRENLCKTQVSGAAATLPHRGEGISNYNQIIYNNQPSPQPSPIGEEVSNYKMLKQVQHDTNSSKRTYSLINLFSYSPRKRAAFTLAEVLLTLGIIGVVAAMTMPVLITNHQKQKTVSYVKKFYNEINNAVRMAVVDNGDVELWVEDYRTSDYNANLQFVQNYILPYIKYLRVDNCYETRVCVYLSYGMFTYNVDSNGGDIAFFINSKYEIFPKNYFGFQFNKRNDNPNLGNRPTVEPYVYKWDGDYNPPESNTLKTASWGGCNTSAGDAKYAYCTKWIQLNDWKIPDDYPWNAKE